MQKQLEMTQRKYVPKHENPLGYGFEEFLLSDMDREELADRFITAREELSGARSKNTELRSQSYHKELLHAKEIRELKRKQARYIFWAIQGGITFGYLISLL